MTPLLAALSSSREAVRRCDCAVAASPLSAASRKRRTAVFSSDFTALLRSRRRSFCPMRLICDLMLATPDLPQVGTSRKDGKQPPRLPAPPRPARTPVDHELSDRHAGVSGPTAHDQLGWAPS